MLELGKKHQSLNANKNKFVYHFIVVLWEEFRNQAKQDLESCRFLFDEKRDYGNSAYLLQQSLEKYTKAYILKYDLFVREPYKFRHLPIDKMWEILRCELERKKKFYKKDLQNFITNFIPMLDLITDYFAKISDSKHKDTRWKYGTWKYSLGLELDSSEYSLFKKLTDDMANELTPILGDAYEIFSNAKNRIVSKISSNPRQKKLLEELAQDIMGTSQSLKVTNNTLHNVDLNNTLVNIPIWFEQVGKLIKKLIELYPHKEVILQTPFMKLLLFTWLFSFRDEMVLTFPHEELGRYPELKGIHSREIYQKNAKNLDMFIKRVSTCCSKVDEMMNL